MIAFPAARATKKGGQQGPLFASRYDAAGLLTRADALFELVEAQQIVHGVGARGAEVRDEHQILQIVGEPMVDIRETAEIRPAFQRIAILKDAVVVAANPIVR